MSDKMKLLIAYDGSACADAALDDLQLFAPLRLCVRNIFQPRESKRNLSYSFNTCASVFNSFSAV